MRATVLTDDKLARPQESRGRPCNESGWGAKGDLSLADSVILTLWKISAYYVTPNDDIAKAPQRYPSDSVEMSALN